TRTTTQTFDNLNELTSITDPRTGVTRFGYDAVGNRVSVTDADANTTTSVFDALNRPVTETVTIVPTGSSSPQAVSRTRGDDAAGQVVSTTDRNGRTISSGYDNLGQRTSEQWLDAQGQPLRSLSWSYDAAGQLLAASDPDAAYHYSYDVYGQLTSVDNAG